MSEKKLPANFPELLRSFLDLYFQLKVKASAEEDARISMSTLDIANMAREMFLVRNEFPAYLRPHGAKINFDGWKEEDVNDLSNLITSAIEDVEAVLDTLNKIFHGKSVRVTDSPPSRAREKAEGICSNIKYLPNASSYPELHFDMEVGPNRWFGFEFREKSAKLQEKSFEYQLNWATRRKFEVI